MVATPEQNDLPLPAFNKPVKVLMVVAPFYRQIADRLVEGAREALEKAGAAHELAEVPGALEVPVAIGIAERDSNFDGYVALGCVIRGETAHFEHVASAARDGILQAGLETRVPIIFGVLTTDTVEQARSRAGELQGNKGAEAALAAIEIAHVLKQFRSPE